MVRIKKAKKDTLSGVFLQYVLMILSGLCALCAGVVLCFLLLVNTGHICPANQAEQDIRAAADDIRTAAVVTEELIPQLCRYVIFSADGAVRGGNLPASFTKNARAAAAGDDFSDRYFYQTIERADETVVLQYRLIPQYRSAFLREHLLHPQALMPLLVFLGGILIIILSSVRFGKKIKRNILPLMQAVGHIRDQELDYEVSDSKIRELSDCLSSIDDMRRALKASLEQQWSAEQEKNRQMSALAHDIKTPLTVVRGNAELLSETALDREQQALLTHITDSSMRIQDYVQRLIAVTTSASGTSAAAERVAVTALLSALKKQTAGLATVCHTEVHWHESLRHASVTLVYDQVLRAVMNVIQNAIEHTDAGGAVHITVTDEKSMLTFTVEDSGSGFSREALLHGTEQFFMDDASRGSDTHYGIGLSFAKTVAEAHGGSITLANAENGGARVELRFAGLF